MKTFTAHTRPARDPVLVPEGWTWAGFLFGPLWLLTQRAWIAGLIDLAAFVLIFALVPPLAAPLSLGLALIVGLTGRDITRWSLDRRGYALSEIVLAPNRDAALSRLFDARPDLIDTIA